MTHDELLELIAANEEFYDDGTNRTPSWSALRAVVELHKPVEVSHNYYDTGFGCSAPSCHNKYDEPGYYPCETIQAIEKELG